MTHDPAAAAPPTRDVAPTPPQALLGLLRGPDGLQVSRGPQGDVTFRRRWWPPSGRSWSLLPAALVWNLGLLGAGYLVWFVLPASDRILFASLALVHAGTAVVLTVAALRRLLVPPTLRASVSALECFSGAPRGRPAVMVSRHAVQQLFVVARGRTRFSVVAQRSRGRPQVLLEGLTEHQAVFIEKYVESLFEIDNAPVRGEHTPLLPP